jgi:hypothetical protein
MTLFDLHLHTDYYSSCSAISPEALVRQAVALELDGIAVTEHGIRWPDDEFDTLRRLAEPHGLILIDAQEVQTYNPKNEVRRVPVWHEELGSDFPPGTGGRCTGRGVQVPPIPRMVVSRRTGITAQGIGSTN